MFPKSSRREFIKQVGALGASGLLPTRGLSSTSADVHVAVANRAPLARNEFYQLPLGSIRPTGWLRDQLRIQADGLGGHLDETWADVGPNSGWLGGTGESWERGPYFLDGLVPLAYLLDDRQLKAKAQKYIDWTLGSQSENGMFGPRSNDDWWPRIVMLKALTQYQEATGDPRVIPVFQRYFKYQLNELPKRPLSDWGKFRWQDEMLSVIWLYNRTGDAKLLELMRLLHSQGYDWLSDSAMHRFWQRTTGDQIRELGGLSDPILASHGVNNGQAVKTGAVWSVLTGSESDRRAVLQTIAALDKYNGLPNGMFSCDEHLAGLDPSHGSELCTVVEFMFSLEQSLAILGDPSLGDRLERLAFNALPGTFTDDMWAHQYDQQPNQVECSLHRRPWVTNGPESNLFGLEPNFGCCTANFHQGWPKFTGSTFMLSSDNGIAATVYAPCEVSTIIGNVPLHIAEETEYPFRGTVRLTMNPESPLNFPLRLRIPAWARDTKIKVNGQSQPTPSSNVFAVIERKWRSGDRVELEFPLQPRVSKWFHDSVAVERGALVFSYGIGEDWVKLRDRGLTADWQVYPKSQWNYALAVTENAVTDITMSDSDLSARPFSGEKAAVTLSVKARKFPKWVAEEGAADELPESPVKSDQAEDTIKLIPYAAAKLRITAFPRLDLGRES
jgi:hypothetical protein